MKRVAFLSLFYLLALAPTQVAAQGDQTGVLTGRVTTAADGNALPGATVTVSSAALQGIRTTTTDVNGVYLLRGLPPGEYHVVLEMLNVAKADRTIRVPLGGTATLDEAMTLALEVTVQVTASQPPPTRATQSAQNFLQSETTFLPVGRTPFLMVDLAAGLTDNAPSASQITISGAFAYDNVWLINGVDVNDNVLGTSNNLFIEEAIGEVQVLSSGISAEYGRFSGGVINLITKSGGNTYSGGFRLNLSNPSWTDETPFETAPRANKFSRVYETVAGGPIRKDRLWFFAAGRWERSTAQGAFPVTAAPLLTDTNSKRYEIKLTGSLRPGHTLQGSYINNDLKTAQSSLSFSVDPRAYVHPHTPNSLSVVNYTGVLGSRVLASAQYSQKQWGVRDNGNTSTSILDSPFLTRTGAQYQYNAPYFDSTDPENRNNRQFTGSLAYFASSPKLGSHDVKGGLERFTSTRIGGNSQTSTGYVFLSDFAVGADLKPLLDANGRFTPRFVPGTSRVQIWMPVRGATIDISTTSLYLQDRVTAGSHVSFDLGMRYEHVSSEASAVTDGLSVDTIVPRLGASYDPQGDGRTVVQATYGQYAGKYNDVQFARNTNVGNPDRYTMAYTGPAGQGLDFAAGFDPANYTTVVSGTFPRDNVKFAADLSSPLTQEFTVGVARQVSGRANARLTYVWRHATNFVEDFVAIGNGKTTVTRNGLTFGTFDNVLWQNTSVPQRNYRAIELESSYRVRSNLQVAGDWTLQLRNEGNFEGEAAGAPAIGSSVGDYSEMLVASRNFPTGRIDDFQRHRVRVWGIYTLGLNRLGAVDIASVWRINSARTYSLVANGVALTATQVARNPGYAGTPSQPLFFGERGSREFKGYALLDMALTYHIPVWQTVGPWVKVEALNVANNQKLISWDTTVTPNNAGAKDENGLPLNEIKGARFGQATSNANFPRPRMGMDGGRTFLMSTGIRF